MTGTPLTLKCPKCKRGKYGFDRIDKGARPTGLFEQRISRSAHQGHGKGGRAFVGHRGLAKCHDCGHQWYSTHHNSGAVRCYGPDSKIEPCTHVNGKTTVKERIK